MKRPTVVKYALVSPTISAMCKSRVLLVNGTRLSSPRAMQHSRHTTPSLRLDFTSATCLWPAQCKVGRISGTCIVWPIIEVYRFYIGAAICRPIQEFDSCTNGIGLRAKTRYPVCPRALLYGAVSITVVVSVANVAVGHGAASS